MVTFRKQKKKDHGTRSSQHCAGVTVEDRGIVVVATCLPTATTRCPRRLLRHGSFPACRVRTEGAQRSRESHHGTISGRSFRRGANYAATSPLRELSPTPGRAATHARGAHERTRRPVRISKSPGLLFFRGAGSPHVVVVVVSDDEHAGGD